MDSVTRGLHSGDLSLLHEIDVKEVAGPNARVTDISKAHEVVPGDVRLMSSM